MIKKKLTQNGFTVIELMIATTVFSVILLLCTMALLQIGKSYSKGVNSAQTQAVARSLIDEVSQSIQFSGKNFSPIADITPPKFRYFCAGGKQYTFMLGSQVNDSGSHGFVSEEGVTGCASPGGWPGTFREHLGLRMRLAEFDITPINAGNHPNLFQIVVRVVYGDNDLLCSPSVAGDCTSDAVSTSLDAPDLKCKDNVGSQYCAVSRLTTTVQKRL